MSHKASVKRTTTYRKRPLCDDLRNALLPQIFFARHFAIFPTTPAPPLFSLDGALSSECPPRPPVRPSAIDTLSSSFSSSFSKVKYYVVRTHVCVRAVVRQDRPSGRARVDGRAACRSGKETDGRGRMEEIPRRVHDMCARLLPSTGLLHNALEEST